MDNVRIFNNENCYKDDEPDENYDKEFEENFNSELKWEIFQEISFKRIRKNDNVIVSAPTSSGKTAIAMYAVKYHLIHNKTNKVYYIAPLKALMSQLFIDTKTYFEENDIKISVGIITGDITCNIDAQFVIMTAEIFMNIMNNELKCAYGINFNVQQQLVCVIMDEIHYISDKVRGSIFEYIIMYLDPKIQLIGLSATIDNYKQFVRWIKRVRKKPISLIINKKRPVPLEIQMFDGTQNVLIKSAYDGLGFHGDYETKIDKDALMRINCMDDGESIGDKKSYSEIIFKRFINHLKENTHLYPVCFIIFSKNTITKLVNMVKKNYKSFLSQNEFKQLEKEINTFKVTHGDCFKNFSSYNELCRALENGIGYHHSTMQPVFKSFVIYLFEKKLIKMLFATETIAVGVNLPIRTIVLIAIKKNCGSLTRRELTQTEIKQISGRAGRRGIHNLGTLILLPYHEEPTPEYKTYITNHFLDQTPSNIETTDTLTFSMYLRYVLANINLNKHYENSFEYYRQKVAMKQKKIDMITKKINDYTRKYDISKKHINDYKSYLTMEKKYNLKSPNSKHTLTNEEKKLQKRYNQLVSGHSELIQFLQEKRELDSKTLEKDFSLDNIKAFFEECNYFMNPKDKVKEIMAAQFDGFNFFLITDIIIGDYLVNLKARDIVLLFSIFLMNYKHEESVNDIDSHLVTHDLKVCIEAIEALAVDYYELQEKHKIDHIDTKYWSLTFNYINVLTTWIDVEDENVTIGELKLIGLDEGLFISNIFRINTLILTIIKIYKDYRSDQTEIIKELNIIPEKIMKGFVLKNIDNLEIDNLET